MLINLLDQTAELFQPVRIQDSYRSQTYQWPSTPALTFPCRLQLKDTDTNAPIKGTPRQWQMYTPASGAVCTVNDRIRISGQMYDIVSVYPVHTPRGLDHMEIVLVNYADEGVPVE